MDEYLQLQHMKEISDNPKDGSKRCYLPHHPVVKEASTTTKVRVVFDASCKTSTGISLNDALYAGPVIQEDLRAILLRGRTRQIMVVADVEKMFRQIWTCALDQRLQCILWRSSPLDEVKTYALATVTYGTKPAPFLATRTLQQLATDEGQRFPLAAVAVKEDTYMDDVITGADNVEEAVRLRIELQDLMEAGGFHLRKWASNCSKVLEGISLENLAIPNTEEVSLESNPSVTTLGLVWIPGTDKLKFKFHVPLLESSELLSKRKILSTIATLFDPTGLVGAVIVGAKIFMQRLWKIQDEDGQLLDWDQPVPSKVGEEWYRFYEHLPWLQEIEVDRCVIITNAVSVEVHCFSDASMKAYGACLYLRSQDASGNVLVRLMTSRSKVAPLKTQSLPRLELCGALLATQLCRKVCEAIRFNGQIHFWTDSTCVLCWIAATPATWTTFVANRVSKIQDLSDGCHWGHVKGVENPADLISRGLNAADIINHDLWWSGPYWLRNVPEQWPIRGAEASKDGEDERRRCTVINAASTCDEFNQWYISKFDSYDDLIRRTAYWLRLMDLLKLPRGKRKNAEFVTVAERKRAEQILIRRVQRESFPEEWKALSKESAVSAKSPLRWFHPFISEEDGLLRIGGRLKHSQEPEDKKHPPILPARHILTRKLLQSYHEKLLHAGPQLLLATVRLHYWPLGGRTLARQLVHNCLRCFRSKPATIQQFMGDLPSSRVTVSRPFSRVGVDYFGPVYVRPGPRRASVKAYVALFVCFCTKAVHMELVTDLSTERFLQALRRFISRRGKPSDIFSDNGTNFVGARNQLRELFDLLRNRDCRETILKACSSDGIQWHFSPPSGPHFGGLWEAAVRSAKKHLLRVLGENVLTFEDMNTLIVQIEACLNSRPLTQLTEDPEDLSALTPAHFLIGSSLQNLPEIDYTDTPVNRLRQWHAVQQKFQHFWKRWKRDYLAQLHGRMKRWKPPVDLEIGKLVVIQDDNQPPFRWKMARIHQLHPGDDEVVRVVTLKTSSGYLKRPVEKICLLPVPNQDDQLQH